MSDKVIVKDKELYNECLTYLRRALNNQNAKFRDGQYECIEGLFNNRRSLVVQKTGWGKSFVYFISTKVNRRKGKGMSIVISPLLTLIDNQIEAAKQMGLNCLSINWTNKEQHEELLQRIQGNTNVDILFVTPETFFNKINAIIQRINIGMLIIDEAHCISDWGHDFRLSFRRISKVLKEYKNTSFPILATTATANEKVIKDLEEQIGPNLYISRGPLHRDNLKIQVIDLEERVRKYAWVREHINKLTGTGIIYCTTTNECDQLSLFLNKEFGENFSRPFHSKLEEIESNENIELFIKNKIRVLVATIKLGMGFDKPDVAFVIHFNIPKDIPAYYQQIGRAARNIKEGTCILLKSRGDEKILKYFIDNMFPDEKYMNLVLDEFKKLPFDKNYLSHYDIIKKYNVPSKEVSKAFKFLEFEDIIHVESGASSGRYYRTANKFVYNRKHYDDIRLQRQNGMTGITSFFNTNKCYSKIIAECLDDKYNSSCGNCFNCTKKEILPKSFSVESLNAAKEFLNENIILIKAKDKYKEKKPGTGQYENPNSYWNKGCYIPAEYDIKEVVDGFALAKYGEEGIGEPVASCKKNNVDYPDELCDIIKNVINKKYREYNIDAVAFVPSLNNKLMDCFSLKLSRKLNVKHLDVLKKKTNISQKSMANYIWQKQNAKDQYEAKNLYDVRNKTILLIDDMVDSAYTLTYCAIKLYAAGAKCVIPVALADSSVKELEDE